MRILCSHHTYISKRLPVIPFVQNMLSNITRLSTTFTIICFILCTLYTSQNKLNKAKFSFKSYVMSTSFISGKNLRPVSSLIAQMSTRLEIIICLCFSFKKSMFYCTVKPLNTGHLLILVIL